MAQILQLGAEDDDTMKSELRKMNIENIMGMTFMLILCNNWRDFFAPHRSDVFIYCNFWNLKSVETKLG